MKQLSAPDCPDCGREMILRKGSWGEFYGCSGFPKCRKTINLKQAGEIARGGTLAGSGRAGGKRKSAESWKPVAPALKADGSKAGIFGVVRPRSTDLIPGSPQQEAVWDLMRADVDGPHICVDASPGSGKTFCLVQGVLRMDPALNIGIVAFNRHIATEMNRQLSEHGIHNARAVTLNSLGWGAVRRAYPNTDLDKHKLADIADELLDKENFDENKAGGKRRYKGPKQESPRNEVRANLLKLVSLSRSFLMNVHDESHLEEIADDYGLDAGNYNAMVFRLAPQLSDLAYEKRESLVDYDDQVWLPVVERLQPDTFDLLMCDEVQDVSRVQLELAMMACPTGRIVIVGDKNQSIFRFRGADSEAIPRTVARLKETSRGCVTMPLTVTRRCPKSHVRLALGIYPHIEALPDAPEGIIRDQLPWKKAVLEMHGGDMVICRVNRYLIPIAYELIRRGVKALIRGRDVGDNIVSLIHKMRAENVVELLSKLRSYHTKESLKLHALGRKGEGRLESLNDRCETLIELCDGVEEIDDLIRKIENLFADFDVDGKPNDAVILGSGHSCKGLESKRVYILAPELLPHPRASSEKDIIQEHNLMWVMGTRAKFTADSPGELIFVKGPDPKSTGRVPDAYKYVRPEEKVTAAAETSGSGETAQSASAVSGMESLIADYKKHTQECQDAWWSRGSGCICDLPDEWSIEEITFSVAPDQTVQLMEPLLLTAGSDLVEDIPTCIEDLSAGMEPDGEALTEPPPLIFDLEETA